VKLKGTGDVGILLKDDHDHLPFKVRLQGKEQNCAYFKFEEIEVCRPVPRHIGTKELQCEHQDLITLVLSFRNLCLYPPHAADLLVLLFDLQQWHLDGNSGYDAITPLSQLMVAMGEGISWPEWAVRQRSACVQQMFEMIQIMTSGEVDLDECKLLLSVASLTDQGPCWVQSLASKIIQCLPSNVFVSGDMQLLWEALPRMQPGLVKLVTERARRCLEAKHNGTGINYVRHLQIYIEPLLASSPDVVHHFCRTLALDVLKQLGGASSAPQDDHIPAHVRKVLSFPRDWGYLFKVLEHPGATDRIFL